MDPILAATAGGATFTLCVLVGSSPRLFVTLTAGYILFLPKVSVVPIPGTTVGLRGEDVLIALLAVKVVLDLLGSALPAELIRVAKWLFALLPIGLVGIVMGLDDGIFESPLVAILFLARRYEYFVLAVAAYLYFRDRQAHRDQALRLLAAAVWVNVAVALAQAFGVVGGIPDGEYVDVSDRVIGLTGGPYELAALLTIALPLFVWRVTSGHQRTSALVAVVAILTALWFTQSRVGLVSAGLVIVAMLIVAARRSPNLIVAGTFATALGVMAVVLRPAATSSGESRFATVEPARMWEATKVAYSSGDYRLIGNDRVVSSISDQSFALRIDRWFNYLDGLMRFNPIAGLGPSAGKEAVDGNYVRVLFEFGLLGLAVLALLILAVRRAALRMPDGPLRAMAVWGGLGLLAQATFIDVFEASKVAETYWFVFGLGIAGMIAERDSEPNEASSTNPASALGR
ncbi:hypothetical protein NOK12_12340 [Nocardioides sp. OK12]|uniref:hypothetical protein n=1 Tax=Nocardioides sp. OK12 TaxID=2758661 RepID=UPI0021C45649|nr:hypothetical protein [Nocardioides sp. OK12]GHJ58716.1 hypothetical protein NOK12_12340 [Nocardioides sp. OK12]